MEYVSESDEIRKKALSMIGRANMLASIHSEMYESYNRQNSFLTLTSIFVSIFILSFSLAPSSLIENVIGIGSDYYTTIIVILSFFSVCLSIALLQLTPGKHASMNSELVTKYTKAKYQIEKKLIQDKDLNIDDLEEIYQLYFSHEDSLLVPNRKFILLKKKYYEYKFISDELKNNPFRSISEIKKLINNKRELK